MTPRIDLDEAHIGGGGGDFLIRSNRKKGVLDGIAHLRYRSIAFDAVNLIEFVRDHDDAN